jgi:hypothetical protein
VVVVADCLEMKKRSGLEWLAKIRKSSGGDDSMDNELDDWQRNIMPYGNDLPIDDSQPDDFTLTDQMAAIKTTAAVKSERARKRKDTQRIGKNSEARAKRVLEKMGFKNVRKMSTKWNGTFSVRARADFAGVEPVSGRDMLCEVKHTQEPKLSWSALRKHQTKNLDKLKANNGIPLLIWTYEKEKIVMDWPVEGFCKGSPLTIERARELDMK